MNSITIYVRYNTMKTDFTTSPDILLGDFKSQLIDRGVLPREEHFIFCKGNETALWEDKTLSENGIKDGDVLDVATPGKAG
ncbi:MAG: hypothetical protein IJ418_15500 [Clostridia bacterium]|nr:hypothetical protein [Clostridia bacterium]